MSVQYYNYTKGKTVLSLKIPQAVLDNENRALSLFICLDISGSMSGSPIRQAKDAILQIMGGLIERKVLAEKDITCFFFQSFCQEIRFRDHPGMLWANGGIKRYFEDVRSGGGTSFSAAFSSIIENLDRINTDLAIIFFTDGQDTDTRNNLEYAKTGLKTALKEASYSTEVHSIGFTNEHDAKLLSWLTKCGRKEGNFLYIRSSDEIVDKMKTTLQLLESSYKTLYVKIGDETPQPANFDDEGVAVLILNDDASNVENKEVKILKDLKEGKEDYIFESLPSQIPASDPMSIQLIIFLVQREIIRLTNEISNYEEDDASKSERFNQILVEVNAYEEQLNTIASKKSSISSVIIQQCLDIKSTVLKFKDVLSEGLFGTLTNEKIAIINDLAYRNIVRQKITKRKLISNRFCEKLCQDFATFYEQKKFCDVTIDVGSCPNKKFEAHASILYARSTFFRKILDKGILHVIEISGISSKTFEVLLKYIYSGYISMDNEPSEIFDLLLAAIKFDFEEVVSYLESQLIKQHRKWLHENFELVHHTSQQHGILVDFCTNATMNMLEKFLSDDFCEIKEAVLIELLKSHKLKLDEIEIWNRILKWGLAKHPSLNPDPKVWSPKEVEAFSMTLKNILPLIQFFQFSSDQFTKSVRPYRKILSEDLYEELISYYMIPGYKPMKF
ncbi:uncharacterized protein OCT59_006650 [Rhizophagus irregularis]|uniref:BTB domain-containing protein n=3 Tax=Rhizophagus irregularis TaxID=588596 RepID=A0A015K5G1_RHIIW|nr:hypothetical protein GLOIN_2v1667259 [Rhizophagus irregularis DAOM 181602=DAOM 197198]EXX77027.1 hypothetical protein RirG_027640 [Rhizophagus irregularis DAOM 197198w]POG65348.1 hypothetical protein GLOIN_2v1667259 [Rhizophagus irregularis DAOM 181602=DAOM 197198]UZO15219.1 hypothetical protein OCT59_006650 [Rhizophagus irregularis]GBC19968.1 BTB/POZ protein [Rhizophagus irregularis DAOM 181602=DAOM 197198]|eukprot:XP_025172214.1 hypothetical protein GLOIN_2v1667259 [Rhizophagus irregularis DAOM 181602=DAOM 197198]